MKGDISTSVTTIGDRYGLSYSIQARNSGRKAPQKMLTGVIASQKAVSKDTASQAQSGSAKVPICEDEQQLHCRNAACLMNASSAINTGADRPAQLNRLSTWPGNTTAVI